MLSKPCEGHNLLLVCQAHVQQVLQFNNQFFDLLMICSDKNNMIKYVWHEVQLESTHAILIFVISLSFQLYEYVNNIKKLNGTHSHFTNYE